MMNIPLFVPGNQPVFNGSYGTKIVSFHKHPFIMNQVTLPENFHFSADQLLPTRDQGQCGSCWAFATTSSIHNRIAIFTNNQIRTPLSVQQLVDCLKQSSGCQGSTIEGPPREIRDTGLKMVPESLYPYQGQDGTCRKNIQSDYYVGVSEFHTLTGDLDGIGSPTHLKYIENIKQNIYQHGPIVFGIEVFPSFMKYDGLTIYEPQPDETSEGGHAILGIGWGKTPNGIEYWICRNSWGANWPPQHIDYFGTGVFFMRMGVNNCSMEEQAIASIPMVFGQNINTNVIPTADEIADQGYYDVNAGRFRRHRVIPVPPTPKPTPSPTPSPSPQRDTTKFIIDLLAVIICVGVIIFLLSTGYRISPVFIILVAVILFLLFYR